MTSIQYVYIRKTFPNNLYVEPILNPVNELKQ